MWLKARNNQSQICRKAIWRSLIHGRLSVRLRERSRRRRLDVVKGVDNVVKAMEDEPRVLNTIPELLVVIPLINTRSGKRKDINLSSSARWSVLRQRTSTYKPRGHVWLYTTNNRDGRCASGGKAFCPPCVATAVKKGRRAPATTAQAA